MNLKTCAACKTVKYCSLACQKRHRPSHKKECRARAAQLFDEALFRQPPPEEDCAVCFLQLPYDGGEISSQCGENTVAYQSCCGKRLCHGCILEVKLGNDTCPFCRTPMTESHAEYLRRCTQRMEAGDADAFESMGTWYLLGEFGLPRDIARGVELSSRAAELGSANAHYNIAQIYFSGEHAPKNAKKYLFHNQQAAIKGHVKARDNLGCYEVELGNWDRAIKHWMIAVASGSKYSLDKIKLMFTKGTVTKAQYERALRTYQNYLEGIQSDQRTIALDFVRAHNQTDSAG